MKNQGMLRHNRGFGALLLGLLLFHSGSAGAGVWVTADSSFSEPPSQEFKSSVQKLDLVLDLDNTLVLRTDPMNLKGGIDLGSEKYNLNHGAVEFIAALSQFPGVQIDFFSAAQEDRNLKLVKELLGLVWVQYGLKIQSEVFSNQYLFHPGAPFQAKGDVRRSPPVWDGKKDLTVLGSSVNLSRVFLVDDSPKMIMEGQWDNWIRVDGGKAPLEKDRNKYFYAANKLIPALGLIAMAIESSESQGISPREASRGIRAANPTREIFFQRGLLEIRKIAPSFQLLGDLVLAAELSAEKTKVF